MAYYIDSLRITKAFRTGSDEPAEDFAESVVRSGQIDAELTFTSLEALGSVLYPNSVLGANRNLYRIDIVPDDAEIEKTPVPISSWQATIQSDRSQFYQCVIPAADPYLSTIAALQGAARVHIIAIANVDSIVVEKRIFNGPLDIFSTYTGPNNTTAVLSAYWEPEDFGAARDVDLLGVRSLTVNSSGATRVRSDIDWDLKPGDTANYEDTTFTVEFINYYVGQGQAYMDVGDR